MTTKCTIQSKDDHSAYITVEDDRLEQGFGFRVPILDIPDQNALDRVVAIKLASQLPPEIPQTEVDLTEGRIFEVPTGVVDKVLGVKDVLDEATVAVKK